ncbi:MAG TPA: macro domain-containing protein [Anaerolineales bacterium]|nr:macro domain-containing protein [Anaerolineales bacterium]
MSRTVLEYRFPDGALLALVQGDLTEVQLEAIVNAANPQLQHGGGLAGAIARRGGKSIQRESNAWVREHGPARFDRPAITGAGDLPCRAVIHAVGPIWGEGDEDRKLAVAVQSSLALASQRGFSSLGMPAISTGVYGFPVQRAAPIVLEAIAAFFAASPNSPVRHVEVTLFDGPTLAVFEDAFRARFTTVNPPGAAPGRP